MARILVIEDNPVSLELTSYLLRAHGHDVLTAADGGAGLVLAGQHRPDLVLCDIQMPVLDGFAFAALMRADPSTSKVPLVALTAAAMPGDRERALASGFVAHVAKPIDLPSFMALVDTHLAAGEPDAPVPVVEQSLGGEPLPPAYLAPRPGLVLLAVDDRAVLRELKRHLLTPAGYTVLGCDSGEAAIELLATQHVDLVLSDVVMPGMGGHELLRRLRAAEATRMLPFVFLSATARTEAERAQGLALGADAYIVRPADPLSLLRVVHELLSPGRPARP
ncbi:MAG: response regulator [Burkholderiaceae bacterium]|nr:response regulator [Rhodoferax sp.]MCP5285185.1 response regulator [Burkholderiaceae bacterium]